MTVTVIGVDPGDSTGVAVLRDGKLIHAMQGEPPAAAVLVEIVLGHPRNDDDSVTLACERFTSGRSQSAMTHQPKAQQVIGVMQHLAEKHGAKFVLQGPADAHAIANGRTLHHLGMHQTRADVDQTDATDANMAVRHALLCLSRQHATIFEKLLDESDAR